MKFTLKPPLKCLNRLHYCLSLQYFMEFKVQNYYYFLFGIYLLNKMFHIYNLYSFIHTALNYLHLKRTLFTSHYAKCSQSIWDINLDSFGFSYTHWCGTHNSVRLLIAFIFEYDLIKRCWWKRIINIHKQNIIYSSFANLYQADQKTSKKPCCERIRIERILIIFYGNNGHFNWTAILNNVYLKIWLTDSNK